MRRFRSTLRGAFYCALIDVIRNIEPELFIKYAGGRAANDGDMIGLFDTVVTRAEADEIITAEI